MPEPAGMNWEHHNIKPIMNNLRKCKSVAVEGPATTTLARPSVILLPLLIPTCILHHPHHPSNFLFNRAQASKVQPSAPSALDEKRAIYSSVSPAPFGMDPKPGVGRTTKDSLSPQQVLSCASTGTFEGDAQHRAMKIAMSVQAVETRIMVLRSVLEPEKIRCSLHIIPALGTYYFENVTYLKNILIFQTPWPKDLMPEFEEFTKWPPQAMALLFVSSQKPIRKSLIKNSNEAIILVLAHMMRWKPLSGLSSHHCFPWFPNLGNPGNFMQCITFHIHVFLPLTFLPLIIPSILICIHVPGVLLQLHATPSIIYPQDPKPPFTTWQRHIAPSPSHIANGLDLLSSYKRTTHSQSTPATILASHQLEESMVSSELLQSISSGYKALVHFWSGLMTIYFFECDVSIYHLIILKGKNGAKLLQKKVAEYNQGASIGTEAKQCWATCQQNLMKMWLVPSGITLILPWVLQLIRILHTVTLTLIIYQKNSAYPGKGWKPSLSVILYLIWDSTGISRLPPSQSQLGKRRNTKWLSRNGYWNRFTLWRKSKSFMKNFSTYPSSYQPDELTSNTFSDASLGVGISIVIAGRWHAWCLVKGWKREGWDIGWAEAVGFEFLVCTLITVSTPGEYFKVFGDNWGVVEGWWKGRSQNTETNRIFKTSQLLTSVLLSQVMSPAKRIQLMDHQEAYTPQHPCYYQPSKSLKIYNPLSSTMIANLFPLSIISQHMEMLPNASQSQKGTTLITTQTMNSTSLTTPSGFKLRKPSSWLRPNEIHVQNSPIVMQTQPATRPAAYSPQLTPNPSIMCPHCLAWECLHLWRPPTSHISRQHVNLSEEEIKRIFDIMANAWSQSTHEAYSSGLLVWLRLDMGAPAGLPGPYPWVFRASKLIPGPVKIFSHGSPGSAGKKPVGHRYPQVNPLFTYR